MSFADYPLWLNITAFAAAAGLVWSAGTKLSRYICRLAPFIGLSSGLAGVVVLGGITSLPEVATTATASLAGNPSLAVNNLLGSLAINVVFLAVADALIGRDALTSVIGRPAPLLQGSLAVILLSVIAITTVTGDIAVVGIGLSSVLIVCLFILSMWTSAIHGEHLPWEVRGRIRGQREADQSPSQVGSTNMFWLVARIVAASLLILLAGYVLTNSADALRIKPA